jgi:hypothetical protein
MIRMAPRTPKAGSSFVARTIGAGVGVGVGVEVVEEERVTETLRVTGTTVVRGMFWSPERVKVVTVTRDVARERDTVGDGDIRETVLRDGDWAATKVRRVKRKRKNMAVKERDQRLSGFVRELERSKHVGGD